jgi:DNA-binding protein H-NS
MPRAANTASQIAKLKKQLEQLQKKEQAVKTKKQDKALDQIVKLVKENAIDLADIKKAMGDGGKAKKATSKKIGASGKKSALKGKTVAPKYRNPSNHEQTWTGRGIAPAWVQALKAENKLETALISH